MQSPRGTGAKLGLALRLSLPLLVLALVYVVSRAPTPSEAGQLARTCSVSSGLLLPFASESTITNGPNEGSHGQGSPSEEAIDFILSPANLPVYAAVSGTVVWANATGDEGGFGHLVVIQHGSIFSYYAHLSTVEVNANDNVTAQTVIGAQGNSGSGAHGTHLHFEARTGITPGDVVGTGDPVCIRDLAGITWNDGCPWDGDPPAPPGPCGEASGARGTTGMLGIVDTVLGMSDDGRYILVVSGDSNLVPDDTNGLSDVFVYDRVDGTIVRANVGAGGEQMDDFGGSGRRQISGDGRYVEFGSFASELVTGDTNTTADVFVRDLLNGTTDRVSVGSSGEQGNGPSYNNSMSRDGRYVAFQSASSNLVSGDANGQGDVFLKDRETGITELISSSHVGELGNEFSSNGLVSDDGRFVAFQSYASNLATVDTNGVQDVFVRDRTASTTELVSRASDGSQASSQSFLQDITTTGRYIVFSTQSSLVPEDIDDEYDSYVHDLEQGTTELATTVNSANWVGISSDGRFIAFDSSSDLVPEDANGFRDTYLRDRETDVTHLVSLGDDGEQGNGHSGGAVITRSGRYVVFSSAASNLVPGDTNGQSDLFIRDRCPDGSCVSFTGTSHPPAVLAASTIAAKAPTKGKLSQTWSSEHGGIDIADPDDTCPGDCSPVHPFAAGEIAAISRSGADSILDFACAVIIDHTPDRAATDSHLFSLYGHLGDGDSIKSTGDDCYTSYIPAANDLDIDDPVGTSTSIGRQGDAGHAFGNHLHFSVFYGKPVALPPPLVGSRPKWDDMINPTGCFELASPPSETTFQLGDPWTCFDGTAFTIAGLQIVVSPGSGVGVEFSEVTAPGTTSVSPGASGGPVTEGYVESAPSARLDVSTSASHAGPIEVCVDHSQFNFFGAPDLFHWIGSAWEKITSGNDPDSPVVCGSTSSLSPFMLAEPDTDLDSVADAIDNCPNWPNAGQPLPAWSVPAADSDCDGFPDISNASGRGRESFVGTDAAQHCSATATPNDEDDAWPSDFNDNRITSLADVIMMGPSYNKSSPDPTYNARFDLNASGTVSLADVLLMGPFYNKSCA